MTTRKPKALTRETQETIDRHLRNGQHPTQDIDTFAKLAFVKEQVVIHDEEIRRVGRTLMKLKNERNAWKAQENRMLSLLAPIRKLPHDMLLHLFEACVQNLDLFFDDTIPDTPQCNFPTIAVTLSQVCHHWRTLTHQSNVLWTWIALDATDMKPERRSRLCRPLSTVIARSGNLPLSVIYCDRTAPDPEGTSDVDAAVCSLLELLTAVAARWERACLRAGPESGAFNGKALSRLRGNLPLLHTLCFESCQGMSFDQFGKSPNLRSLTLWTVDVETFVIDWSQLLHLSIWLPSTDDVIRVLSLATRLEALTSTAPPTAFITQRRMSTPVKTLYFLINDESPDIVDVFDMCLPKYLQALRIDDYKMWPKDETDVVEGRFSRLPVMLETCGNTITEVHFEFLVSPLSLIIMALDLLPAAEVVRVSHERPLEKILLRLQPTSHQRILPKLRHLTLCGLDPITKERGCIDALEARWSPPSGEGETISCLEYASLQFTRHAFSQHSISKLRLLSDLGMNITVEDSSGFLTLSSEIVSIPMVAVGQCGDIKVEAC